MVNRRVLRRSAGWVLVTAGVVAGASISFGTHAGAQSIDPRRPTTVAVGPPQTPSPMARVDARRRGLSHEALPPSNVHVAWRKTLGLATEQPVLVLSDGTLAFVSTRGEVVFLTDDGQDTARVSSFSGGASGPAAVLADGTVAFATSSGDVVGVHPSRARPRFVAHVGGDRNTKAAPLPLDDGGAVFVLGSDLVVVDGAGGVRARTTLPELPAAPLVGSGDRVLATTVSGAVYAWSFGMDPTRVGSFGDRIDGSPALHGGALVAVTESGQVVALELKSGSATTRATDSQGGFLGPPSLRPGKAGGVLTTVLLYGPTRTFLVTLDEAGQEIARAPVGATRTAVDAGARIAGTVPPHVGPLVDARGAAVAVTPEGSLAVVSPESAVDGFGESICSANRRSAGVAGISPLGPQAFAVTCEAGVVVRVDGPGASRERRSRLRPLPGVSSPPVLRPAPTTAPESERSSDDDED